MFNIFMEQIVDANLNEVFEFFENPENLGVITPDWMKFEILTPRPLIMKKDAEFDYRINLFSVPLKWKTIITDYDPPYKFVDVQKNGPYKYWHHTHLFETEGDKTKITDNIDYKLYGGPIGVLINNIYVRKNLKSIFDFRENKINQLFNTKGVQNDTI
ncbi:MAG: SRPBCC family protein [Ignavibacterium sp.]|nr:SRPBCC family protein [Melioribacteraceae bacterium]MCO6473066.1 SRPBCC family protein [Melioribacteraceae bacterium]MDD3558238.1 SRPBCC family protein [Melioribacteraceae bacterium]MDD5609687.1 SRPBCC family protein [Ignavibacterium sp.]